MSVLEDFARQLANLQKQWSPGNTDVAEQGKILRQNAAKQGINLYNLEDEAHKVGWGTPMNANDQKSSYDYVNSLNIQNPMTSAPVVQAKPQNNYIQQANSMVPQIQSMVNNGFKYDPANDPIYQSAQKLAAANAKDASKSAMETMNDRGILNSSVTASQLGQIEQKSKNQVDALIPQLSSNAFNQYQSGIQNQMNLFNTLQGTGERQDQTNWNHALTQEQMTGNWMNPDAANLINQIIQSKYDWGAHNGAGQNDLAAQDHQKAEQARLALQQYGFTPDQVNENVGISDLYNLLGKGVQSYRAKQDETRNKQWEETQKQNQNNWQKNFDLNEYTSLYKTENGSSAKNTSSYLQAIGKELPNTDLSTAVTKILTNDYPTLVGDGVDVQQALDFVVRSKSGMSAAQYAQQNPNDPVSKMIIGKLADIGKIQSNEKNAQTDSTGGIFGKK